MRHLLAASAPALILVLAACSSKPTAAEEPPATPVASDGGAADTVTGDENASDAAAGTKPMVMPVGTPPVLEPEGLGELRIGKAVPAGSGWRDLAAKDPDVCHIFESGDFPGVYAIVENGKVRRITAGEEAGVTLADGIGVGASEAAVKAAYPGFKSEPHAYDSDPAKYLTDPAAGERHPGLRFEIGQDGKVSLIHAGTMPDLTYVEGCA
ncbi:hypothetical protein [Novosphingobium album (ex Hu et al. 2023)]|uniref:Uncharacterized protein n=1 Tax=Novosphingobium album (ex Hu et al. 2023) TaxID=2930093 RepID=A0ABT0B3X2_9SPHN|nr:hypothetical protein [Novosphingobium album (ex Hu et al. 2023)]MCJ2179751.1 hypothetical protein [Novosphingobium album (ex Hu et al. 2023)]